ncbi:Hypothetical predicted protein [Paramuricea clavata]|uniref:Uncharacterized protein n=1 Tax=Paramuricea clavata TaxID=317549 RepID=A0A6S7FTX1_PARCT|nr:Hypothetical predicted protein [Paramuricea clavata]
MKIVLVDAKAVLESKLSEIDLCLDKANNVATIVDNSTQSLVQLQMTYPWLQVKLRSPPNALLGACCLCQHHSLQIRLLCGYSSMQNWLNCFVVLDSDHHAQRVKNHEPLECHKSSKSAEEQRKRNAILFSSQVAQKKETEATESQSAFTSEAAQSDLYPLWDDKANVDKFIGNITKMNEMPVLENPLNRRLRLQYPSIGEGNFMPNFSKPDQQVNILQHDVQFQPWVRHRPQPLTPDDIIRTTEDRLKQLTPAILRAAPIFLAMGKQEENVIKMFDVKSFDYHSSESLCEQNNNEFISFAKHLNRDNLSFP